ncbi:MAG: LPS assembly lipoprotein LptE [Pseudomonadota bacterium]
MTLVFPPLRLGAMLLLSLAVAACGFQLRGEQTLPEVMAVTYVDGPDRESLLFETLVEALKRTDIQITDDASEATAVLMLVQDIAGQRVLSVTTQGNPEEYELYRTLQYELVAGEETLVRSLPITVTRDYAWVETDVIGTQRQAQRLDAGLADELTALIIRTLSAAR